MQPRIFQMKEGFPIAFKLSVPENIHTHPMEGYWKFKGGGDGRGRGRGVSKAINFQGKHRAKVEFLEGWEEKKHWGV